MLNNQHYLGFVECKVVSVDKIGELVYFKV